MEAAGGIQKGMQHTSVPPPEVGTAVLVKIADTRKRSVAAQGDIPNRIPLIGERVTIGRGDFNTAVITDVRLSRNHAELTFRRSKWRIKDQSLNGIYINGQRLSKNSPFRLENGDVIQLIPCPDGKELQYRIEYLTQSTPAAVPGVNVGGSSNKINDPSIEILTGQPESQVPSTSRTVGPAIENRERETPDVIVTRLPCGSKMDPTPTSKGASGKQNETNSAGNATSSSESKDKVTPISSNLTTDFEKIDLVLLEPEDNELATPRLDNLDSEKLTLDDKKEAQQDQDSDCIILEFEDSNSYYKDCEDTSMETDIASAKKAKLNHDDPVRASLLQEVKALQKSLAEQTHTNKKETDEVTSSIEKLKLDISEQRRKNKNELFNCFQDLKCFVCKTQFIEPTRLDPCAHVFCLFCINESNKNNAVRKCPQCHMNITEESKDFHLEDLISEGFTVTPEDFIEERKKRVAERAGLSKV